MGIPQGLSLCFSSLCFSADNPHAQALLPYLLDRGDRGDLKRLATEQGLAQNTLLQRLRRMRLRLRDLLRDEFAQLVADPASIDVELSIFQQALMRER